MSESETTQRRMIDVTVCMPTLPERDALRAQALASIEAQTVWPAAVLYEIDHNHTGPVAALNRVAKRVETTWLFPFADDDLLDPEHFEVLETGLDGSVDIVWTWCRVTGRPDIPEDLFQVERPLEELRRRNWIPSSAAIRTELWRYLGGYQDPGILAHEDWHFWLRAMKEGSRFRCIPKVTWSYRVDPTWKHVSDGSLV